MRGSIAHSFASAFIAICVVVVIGVWREAQPEHIAAVAAAGGLLGFLTILFGW